VFQCTAANVAGKTKAFFSIKIPPLIKIPPVPIPQHLCANEEEEPMLLPKLFEGPKLYETPQIPQNLVVGAGGQKFIDCILHQVKENPPLSTPSN
jgi:hypothetical protein